MNVLTAVNYLLGYISFTVTGAQTERFLTRVMETNTDIWSIRRIDAATIRAVARRFDEKRIRELCTESYCEMKLLYEKGVPKILRRYKSRYGLMSGIVLFFALIAVMSGFVWSIDIEGAENVWQRERIASLLSDNGLYVGAWRRNIDSQKVKLRVLSQTDDIAYLTININGSKAYVELMKKKDKPELLDETKPCNVIAKEMGQIVSAESDNGTLAVKKGEAVVEGQLLISGVYNSNVIGYRLVHAYGSVKARVLRRISAFVGYEEYEIEKTGRKQTSSAISLFGSAVKLSESRFEEYHTQSEKTDLTIGESFVLPISITKVTYSEYERVKKNYTYDEALKKAVDILDERERLELREVEVENRLFEVIECADGIYCEYIYTVITEIGKSQEIYTEELNGKNTDN